MRAKAAKRRMSFGACRLQLDATAEEYVPAAQTMHAAEDGLPVDGLYVPTGHAVHADAEALPVDGLYVPAGQEVHADAEALPVNGL
jgi:hypothetical protein